MESRPEDICFSALALGFFVLETPSNYILYLISRMMSVHFSNSAYLYLFILTA